MARAERTQFWLEQCIEIADDATAEAKALEPIGVAKKRAQPKSIERPSIA